MVKIRPRISLINADPTYICENLRDPRDIYYLKFPKLSLILFDIISKQKGRKVPALLLIVNSLFNLRLQSLSFCFEYVLCIFCCNQIYQ